MGVACGSYNTSAEAEKEMNSANLIPQGSVISKSITVSGYTVTPSTPTSPNSPEETRSLGIILGITIPLLILCNYYLTQYLPLSLW